MRRKKLSYRNHYPIIMWLLQLGGLGNIMQGLCIHMGLHKHGHQITQTQGFGVVVVVSLLFGSSGSVGSVGSSVGSSGGSDGSLGSSVGGAGVGSGRNCKCLTCPLSYLNFSHKLIFFFSIQIFDMCFEIN